MATRDRISAASIESLMRGQTSVIAYLQASILEEHEPRDIRELGAALTNAIDKLATLDGISSGISNG